MTAAPDTARVHDALALEAVAGYSRAARCGAVIAVSGTTANAPDGGALHPGDTGAQTRAALAHALDCVRELGGRRESVVRTRLLLTPDADWRAASAAHAELLGDVAPANSTYVVHALVGDGFLVEVEVDAVAVDDLPGAEAAGVAG